MRIGTDENERGVIFFSGDGIEEFNYINHENNNGLNDIETIQAYYEPIRLKALEIYDNAVKGNGGTGKKMLEEAMSLEYNLLFKNIIKCASDEQ